MDANADFGDQKMNAYCKGLALESDLCTAYYEGRGTAGKRFLPAIYKENLKNWCKLNNGQNFAPEFGVCRTFALNDETSLLDEGANLYCQNYPKDKYCTCSPTFIKSLRPPGMSDENFDQLARNPICALKDCSLTGYKFMGPRQMWKKGCGPIQICNIQISNIKASEIKDISCQQTVNVAGVGQVAYKPADLSAIPQSSIVQPSQISAPAPIDKFLPLPDSIRQITDPWGLPDELLTGGAVFIIVFLAWILGFFGEDEYIDLPYDPRYIMQMQQMMTPGAPQMQFQQP
jgi:hypothetical protein